MVLAERQRDDLLAELQQAAGAEGGEHGGAVMYDAGTELWQNTWHQNGTSKALTFPTNKSVVCRSIESDHSHMDMPGVHAEGAINKGKTSQSIWIKPVLNLYGPVCNSL